MKSPQRILAGFHDGSETDGSRQRRLFLDPKERATGMHVIGSPGSGKSKFLEWLIRQDIDAGHGVALIDPHGSLYADVLSHCAWERPRRPVYCLDVSDPRRIFGFNAFRGHPGAPVSTQARRHLLALLKACGLEESQDITVLLNRWVTNIFTVLIERGLTVPEIEFLLEDEHSNLREFLTSESSVRSDWKKLKRELADNPRNDPLGSSYNRLTTLYRDVGIRRFMGITDPAVNLDLERVMDESAIVLVNLQPSDYLDEMSGRLFGTMLMSEFFAAARRRKPARGSDNPRPYYLYADEAQEYLTHDVARIFAQGRKMGLSLVLAHQYLDQVGEEDRRILSALHNACKTKAVFGIGGDADAKALVHELWPGQIDYNEVKRIDYSLKFWQQYGRDKVITDTESHSQAHSEGHSTGSNWADGSSSVTTIGHANPTNPNLLYGTDTQNFATGQTRQSGGSDASMSSDTETDTYGHAVADVPIYHQIPILEPTETPWSLEEQRQRLADALRGQYQRHCFFRGPDMQCRPLLVPKVEPVGLSERRVGEYTQQIADKVGALPADAVDQLIDDRRRELEHSAKTYFDQLEQQAVQSEPHARQDKAILPTRRQSQGAKEQDPRPGPTGRSRRRSPG